MALIDSLIAYWPLDEENGGDALDVFGDNNLTLNGASASVAGLISGARDFEIDSAGFFERADNAALSTGDITFSFAIWVKLESKPAAIMGIAGKGGGTGGADDNEWGLYWNNSTDRFTFGVYDGVSSSGSIAADTFGAPSTGTWYLLIVEHNATANTITIQVNNGTIDSASYSSGSNDSANSFKLGIFAGSSRYWDGLMEGAGFWKRALTTDERTELYNAGAGRTWAHISGTAGLLPTFDKLGAKLSFSDVSGWMPTGTVTFDGPFFPRILENDLYRATLTGLPADRFSCLFSTDHSSGDGLIGRADFDTIEGTWTDSGAAIHTGANQRETPHPVYDPVNEVVNVYVHDNTSAVTNGNQAARLLTTTDLETLTDQGEVFGYGAHTGYAYVERVGTGNWRAIHGLQNANQHNAWIFAKSTSATGDTSSWTRGNALHARLSQLAPPSGYVFSGEPSWFTWDGQEFILQGLLNLGGSTQRLVEIVAIPVADDGLSPSGGYIRLVRQGTGTDPDVGGFRGLGQVIDVDGTLYITYIGIDENDELSICLAKANGGSSVQVTPGWQFPTSGTLPTLLDWDAVNETLPAELSIVVDAGSNASSHSDGNYYEVKTGSGSSQILYLRTDDTYDPTDYEYLECEWDIITHDTAGITKRVFTLAFVDDFTTPNGVQVLWSTAADDRRAGKAYVQAAGSDVATEQLRALSLATGTGEDNWSLTNRFRIKLRFHDSGTRASLFVDDSCCWERDIDADGVSFGTGGFFALKLTSIDTFPAVYVRLAGMTVKAGAFSSDPLTSGLVTLRSQGETGVILNVDPATGGTGPYTYQWYRSTTQGFTPGGGNILTGKTDRLLVNTGLTANTVYYYVCRATDAAAATVDSAEFDVKTLGATVAAPLPDAFASHTLANDTANGTLAWNHTCSGSNRVLFVAFTNYLDKYISARYAGIPMLPIDFVSSNGPFVLFHLPNPPLGEHEVEVTWEHIAGEYEPVGVSGSFKDADTIEQFTQPHVLASSATGNPTIDVPLDSNEIAVLFLKTANVATEATGQTLHESEGASNRTKIASDDVETNSWTQTSGPWALFGLALKPVGSGGNRPQPAIEYFDRDMPTWAETMRDGVVAGYDDWIANGNKNADAVLAIWSEGGTYSWYYDWTLVGYNLANYLGDASYATAAWKGLQVVDECYYDNGATDYGIPANRVFTRGPLADWLARAATHSKEIIEDLRDKPAYASDIELIDDPALMRDLAYHVAAHIHAVLAGVAPRTTRYNTCIDWAYDHLTYFFDDLGWVGVDIQFSPFLVGLMARSLIEDYSTSSDVRCLPALTLACNYCWEHGWLPQYMGIKYDLNPDSSQVGSVPDDETSTLNNLIAPMYAWVASQTGDPTQMDRADMLFAGSAICSRGSSNGKQINQRLVWVFGDEGLFGYREDFYPAEGPEQPATTIAITGPSTIVVGVPRTYTIETDGDDTDITIDLTTDGDGTWTPNQIVGDGSMSYSATYEANDHADSPHTLGSTDDGGLTNGTKVVTVLEVAPVGAGRGGSWRRRRRTG